nr:MAG TPA: hypothetical protein [Bacteriophage sp.]
MPVITFNIYSIILTVNINIYSFWWSIIRKTYIISILRNTISRSISKHIFFTFIIPLNRYVFYISILFFHSICQFFI